VIFLEAVSNPQYTLDLGPVLAAVLALVGVAAVFFLFIKYANKSGKEAVAEARRIAEKAKESTLVAVSEKIGTCQLLHDERDKQKTNALDDTKRLAARLDEKFEDQTKEITKMGVEVNTMGKQISVIFKRMNGALDR